MTSVDLDAPRRDVVTPWGDLLAVSAHPLRVRFLSWSGLDDTPPFLVRKTSHVTINGKPYWFDGTFSRAPMPPDQRHGRRYLDPTWHVDKVLPWSLRRPGSHGDTGNEMVVAFARTHLTPFLIRWLTTDPEAVKLMQEAATYWRTSCLRDADLAEGRLGEALDQLTALRAQVEDGLTLSDVDEEFLRHLNTTVEPEPPEERH